MTGTWFLALLAAAQPAVQQEVTAQIEVRPSIEPAIMQYLQCLVRAQDGMQWGDPPRAARLRRFVEQSRQGCAQARVAARTQALRLIESDSAVPAAERGAVVDTALDRVDASDEVLLREAERQDQGLSSPKAAVQPAPAPPVMERRAVPMGRLDIPDEIAPAVVPYLRCLMASRGVPEGAPGSAARAQAPSVAPGTDCTPVRAVAARNAESMLAAQHRGSPQERAALIERTLAGVDSFAAGFAPPPADSTRDVPKHAQKLPGTILGGSVG